MLLIGLLFVVAGAIVFLVLKKKKAKEKASQMEGLGKTEVLGKTDIIADTMVMKPKEEPPQIELEEVELVKKVKPKEEVK